MCRLFLELAFQRITIMIFQEESHDMAVCKLPKLIAQNVGRVNMALEIMRPPAEVHGVNRQSIDLLAAVYKPKVMETQLHAAFSIIAANMVGIVLGHNPTQLAIEADRFCQVIGCSKVYVFITGVSAVESGVVQEEFVSNMAGDVIGAQAELPPVEGISQRKAYIVVGIDQWRGVVKRIEASPNTAFDVDLQVSAPRQDVNPSIHGNAVPKGDIDDIFDKDAVIFAPSYRVIWLAGIGHQWPK